MTKNPINEAHEAVENEETESTEPTKREIVVPGETIVTGEDYLPSDGTRREGEDVKANRYGLSELQGRVVKVIPIFGAFVPRRNNVIIGKVAEITFNGWLLDIEAAGSAFLGLDECPRFINRYEMDQFLNIGDVVAAKITSVKAKGIDMSIKGRGLGKLEGGFIFKVIPSRVPRVIGREGSMITLIKEKTGCNITVGQNGWVWIRGDEIQKELLARKAVEFVTEKAYVEGLTDKMETWFDDQEKKK